MKTPQPHKTPEPVVASNPHKAPQPAYQTPQPVAPFKQPQAERIAITTDSMDPMEGGTQFNVSFHRTNTGHFPTSPFVHVQPAMGESGPSGDVVLESTLSFFVATGSFAVLEARLTDGDGILRDGPELTGSFSG